LTEKTAGFGGICVHGKAYGRGVDAAAEHCGVSGFYGCPCCEHAQECHARDTAAAHEDACRIGQHGRLAQGKGSETQAELSA
jgi:hypothetical protein